MTENIFGANIIEILTAGMYQNSKVIYREYIQNSCDQIDKAEQLGILPQRNTDGRYPDSGQGIVNIWLKPEDRYISIEDNATGITVADFEKTLRKTADSDKIIGQNKGFRGIGKLCGLAYCKRLVFTSRWSGENVVSIVSYDAQKMRKMINEVNTKAERHSANDVLNAISEFSTRDADDSDPKHFFRVELIDINDENEELFGGRDEDNLKRLIDYLSFVAPVPYSGDFLYRSEVYDHAKKIGVKIDEYVIKINGTQIFKKYKTRLKTGNGEDQVFDVQFHDFIADDNSLLGWMWFGETSFKAAIKEEEISRGLRLRKENIQIGNDDILRGMFTRDKRGNSYFIGEVFAVSRELIPNSQRSYFNENPTRIDFEYTMKDYFNNILYPIYYEGSDINSSIKKIHSYNDKRTEFEKKSSEGGFVTIDERNREESVLKAKEQEAEKAKRNLDKKRQSTRSILTQKIIERRAKEIPTIIENKDTNEISEDRQTKINEPTDRKDEVKTYKPKQKFLVDGMFPRASRNERKLLSDTLEKIFVIIQKSADKKTSEKIINTIREELR